MRSCLVASAILLTSTVADAHIRITSPTPRSTTVLKQRHCGATGSARANVQTFAPGATLHLVWDEYVAHPGWFRVSFQENGDVFETPPASNGPTGGGAPSNYPTEDLTGTTDAATGSLIIADRIMHPALSLDVVLPNVECNNCTLQLIQMMIDKPPYTTDLASNDIYYACVDLVISATAPPPDAGVSNGGDGGVDPDAGSSGSGGSGGCSVADGSSCVLALAIIGLLRRRRCNTKRRSAT